MEGLQEWNRVNAALENDPDNFELWQDLIDRAHALEGGINRYSTKDAIDIVRDSYDRLLERFPLLHGFWIKYANVEFRLGSSDNADKVYERALGYIPRGSVQLWVEYCKFMLLTTTRNMDHIRTVLERAAAAIGSHFLAHEFWDVYIEFEEREGDLNGVFKVVLRAASNPLHQYAKYFDKLRRLQDKVHCDVLVPPFEADRIRAEIELEQIEGTGNNLPFEQDFRERAQLYHFELYQKVQAQVSKRWQYESAIHREHFHIAFLEELELVNWRKYLQFEMVENSKTDIDRVLLLFERAIVPSALHEEVWLLYVRFLIASELYDEALSVFGRACKVLPVGRTEVRLLYAKFMESQGDISAARAIYRGMLRALPSSVEVILHLCGLESRAQASVKGGIAVLEDALASGDVRFEDKHMLLAELARLEFKATGTADSSRELYSSYANVFANMFYFWREYLRFEMGQPHSNGKLDHVRNVMEQIENTELEDSLLKDLRHMYQEFILREGTTLEDYFSQPKIGNPMSVS